MLTDYFTKRFQMNGYKTRYVNDPNLKEQTNKQNQPPFLTIPSKQLIPFFGILLIKTKTNKSKQNKQNNNNINNNNNNKDKQTKTRLSISYSV